MFTKDSDTFIKYALREKRNTLDLLLKIMAIFSLNYIFYF